MRIVALSCLVLATLAAAARSDDAADARAIIAKAAKAAGYSSDKSVAMTWKDKGTFIGGGLTFPYTGEWAFQGPDKYSFAIVADSGGMKIDFRVVVNGDKAWESGFGKTQEMTGPKLEQTLREVYQFNVLCLAPLLSDKEFKLTLAGEKDVNGKPAAVVKVTRDKQPAITIYFDKGTGLLTKCEMMVKDEFQDWKEVPEETYFEDYKEIDGRQMFMKMRVFRDGKKMVDAALFDQKAHDKLDAKLFAKP